MNKRTKLVTLFFLSIFFANTVFAFTVTCPLPERIKIISYFDPDFPDDHLAWVPPAQGSLIVPTAPQQGHKVTGKVNEVRVLQNTMAGLIDLSCFYPTDATTPRIPAPPNTGWISYWIYGALPQEFCKENETKDGFICGE